jgi:HSP20 family molecular chaperone IbpA
MMLTIPTTCGWNMPAPSLLRRHLKRRRTSDLDLAFSDVLDLFDSSRDLEDTFLGECRSSFSPFSPLIRAFNVRLPVENSHQSEEQKESNREDKEVKDQQGAADSQAQSKAGKTDKTDNKPTTVAVSPDADNNSLRLFSLARPTFQWAHTKEGGFVLTACTPGLNKNDISVEVVDGDDATHKFLVVAGESGKTTDTDGIKATQYAKFERRVRLPGNLPKDSIDAKYEDGVLTVRVAAPPAPVEQPKKVEKIAIA